MFKWFCTIFSLGAPDIPSRTTSGVQPRIENYKDERLKVISSNLFHKEYGGQTTISLKKLDNVKTIRCPYY